MANVLLTTGPVAIAGGRVRPDAPDRRCVDTDASSSMEDLLGATVDADRYVRRPGRAWHVDGIATTGRLRLCRRWRA